MNGPWWTAVVQWRNWPLLVKLGVVLIVPVVGALVLGVLRVHQDVQRAGTYEDIERVAALRVELGHALSAVQEERNEIARGGELLDRVTPITDNAIERMRAALGRAPELDEQVTVRYRAMNAVLWLVDYARERYAAGGDRWVILNAYNTVAQVVLEFDRALVGRFPDEQLTGTSIALNELQAIREQVGVQQASGLLGFADGRLDPVESKPIVEADLKFEDNLNDFEAVAPPDMLDRYRYAVTVPAVSDRQVMSDSIPAGVARFTAQEWNEALAATADVMRQVSREEANRLRAESGRLAEYVSNLAGAESVLLATLVLLAAGIGGGLGRYLLRSFGTLRRTALEVASTRLPAAVEAIRAGETERAAIDPVPLRTTEEFGQLARAFDEVHTQAVRSAAGEADLRRDLSNIFLNLSRRSQGLVERQLRQLEQLEQKADDPDQLANLFRIDHLATRMRRNNENLMVLSGAVLSRRFTEPVPLPDILRAAVSEVEQYQRALVRSAPGARIVGYAAGDLIRTVAELIENATTFSPPERQVTVECTEHTDGSLRVDVLDEGVGLGDAELAEANQRVAAGGGVDVPISRQMGLFVVGRLTARHGITVALSRRESVGLCASVTVPANLVTAPAVVAPPATAHAVEVSGRLELAGIHVRLPEFPSARTPASILFTAHTPADSADQAAVATAEPASFTWLRRPFTTQRPRAAAPPAGAAPAVSSTVTAPSGLPKRVPKGRPVAPAGPPPASGRPARDPARARGFLSAFQAGVRDGQNRKGEGEQ